MRIAFILLGILILSGCLDQPEQYRKVPFRSGVEYGVRIEVMLATGGTAILVCPKFTSKPLPTTGVQCYLESYDNRVSY